MTRTVRGTRREDPPHQLYTRRLGSAPIAAALSVAGLVIAALKCILGQL